MRISRGAAAAITVTETPRATGRPRSLDPEELDVETSFPERLLALLDSLGFGYSNICKHSVVQFQQCFALSPSLAAPDS
jgi:hypothetical protein